MSGCDVKGSAFPLAAAHRFMEKLKERARCLVEGVLAWLVPVLCVVGIMVEGTVTEVAAELIWDSKKGRRREQEQTVPSPNL